MKLYNSFLNIHFTDSLRRIGAGIKRTSLRTITCDINRWNHQLSRMEEDVFGNGL